MARKTKAINEDPAKRPEPEYDPSGHYDFCIAVISPPGHRPLSNCGVKVWWHGRRPLAWSTKKAAADDHGTEHVCREWTPGEDARLYAEMESVSAQRHSIKGDTAVSLQRMRQSSLDAAIDLSGPAGLPGEVAGAILKGAEDYPPLIIARKKKRLADKAATNITLDGEKADANLRGARKVHSCSACERPIGHGVRYLESRVGAKSAFEPFRYCEKCWPGLGYVVSE